MSWITLFLSACLLIYLVFVLRNAWVFAQIPSQSYSAENGFPFVSVIIPARNEEKAIEKCLLSVLNQSWPQDRFEVILINDHSTDRTKEIAIDLTKEYPNLQVIDLLEDNLNSYKKAAIALGIKHSSGEIIMQTDGDCVVTSDWIRSMIACFEPSTAYVSGPVQLDYRSNWFEKLQSLESMGLIVLGAGSIADNRPNMSNGANMAYRRSVFEEIEGFTGIDNVASGDDELLLQKIHKLRKYKLVFAKDRQAIVRTEAVASWKAFKAQRLRWVSKARAYHDKSVNRIQMISWLGFLTFPLLMIFGLVDARYWLAILFLFGLKILADYLLMYQAAKFFHKLHLLPWVLLLQLVYIPYVLWIGIAGNLVKNYNWKGRSVQ